MAARDCELKLVEARALVLFEPVRLPQRRQNSGPKDHSEKNSGLDMFFHSRLEVRELTRRSSRPSFPSPFLDTATASGPTLCSIGPAWGRDLVLALVG